MSSYEEKINFFGVHDNFFGLKTIIDFKFIFWKQKKKDFQFVDVCAVSNL